MTSRTSKQAKLMRYNGMLQAASAESSRVGRTTLYRHLKWGLAALMET